MPSIAQVRQSLAKLDATTAPQVALFVGATSGIGKTALEELVRLGFPLKAYVVGRKESEASFKPFLDELRAANPKAELIWVEGQVTLLAEVQRICKDIKARESKLDLLLLTPGYIPWAGRNDTAEGLDATHVLQYFCRILFTINLLPLLRASGRGRVICVLSGSLVSASKLNPDDLLLEKPGAFGAIASQQHMSSMGTLSLDRLAADPANASVVFIHSYPGVVNTGNLSRGWARGSVIGPLLIRFVLEPIFWLVGFSFKEAGERHAYMATSGAFGGKGPLADGARPEAATDGRKGTGGGLYLLNQKNDVAYSATELKLLREKGQEKTWEKTQEILGPYL